MYIIGELLKENKFKSIYAVFDNELLLNEYHKKNFVRLDIEKSDIDFPFFIIEEFNEPARYYKSISKKELRYRIQQFKKLDDSKFVYFNLWRIDNNLYNENFPKDPILRGVDFHIHFTDTDMKQIETNGFDTYWQEIITV